MLLRLTNALLVVLSGVAYWTKGAHTGPDALVVISYVFSLLVLLGLCTPIACVLSAGAQTALLLKESDDSRVLICLIGINLAIAMLGPGDVSIDSIIFGRQRLEIPDR